MVKAYSYIIMLGKEGLIQVSEQAVLNANYIKEKLKAYYDLPAATCMHECVFSASSWSTACTPSNRQVPHRQGVSPPDGLLPDDRQGSDHDRTDRDRE
jgi:glycine cleavage system protein P-like pyridoxal-binding family